MPLCCPDFAPTHVPARPFLALLTRFSKSEYDDPRVIQALDGQQNEWDILCRPDPPVPPLQKGRSKGASLQVEIVVRVKPTGGLPALKPGRNRVRLGLDAESPRDFQVQVLTTKVYR